MTKRNCAGHLWWILSLFFIGLAAKLQLIQKFGLPLPYLDEWPAEAIGVFIPWFTHQFSILTLFQPRNEHHIVFTHLCELGLLLANGQWDAQLEMVVNAAIHSLAIAGFGWLMATLLGKRAWPWIWLVLVLDLVLPFAWENTLWGFQSQFYFLEMVSILILWLLGLSEPLSVRWWLGVICAVVALFTMASGFLAVDAVGALVLLDILRQRANWKRHLPTLLLCAIISISGLLLPPHIAEHDVLRSHSVGEFFKSLGKNLAWPWPTKPFYALFNLFPLAVLAWNWFRSKQESVADRMIVGIGVWVILQSLAAAYARGVGGGTPAWRYMDVLSFVMIANVLSIWRLITHYRERMKWKPACQAGFALWALGCASGLFYLTQRAWTDYIPGAAHDQAMQLENTRAFLASNDPQVLMNHPGEQLIVGNVDAVVWILRNPVVRNILPACAREPSKLTPGDNGSNGFVRNGAALGHPELPTELSWGSYTAQGAKAVGAFESLPVPKSGLPYLEIPVVGDWDKPGLSLELVDLSTGKKTAVHPSSSPGGHWINAEVPSPAGDFKVVAQDESPDGWLAFKAPRELGRLSHWAKKVIAAWKIILAAGLVFLVMAVIAKISRPTCADTSDTPPNTAPPCK